MKEIQMNAKNTRFRLALPVLLVAAAFGTHGAAAGRSGAAVDAETSEAAQRSGDFRAEASDRQTRVLTLGTNGSLELRTVSGDITVTAGSGRDVSLEIIKTSRGRTDADAKTGLQEVQVVVDHQGERATVSNVYPEGRRSSPFSVDISYIVTAPAGTRISTSSVSGDVTLRNIKGDISAGSTSGDVHITGAAQVSAAKSVSGDVTILNLTSTAGTRAMSVSGDILLDQVKAQRVDAESVSGSVVATGVTCEHAMLKSVSGDIEYAGGIARGGRYEFQSHSGDVRLTTTGDVGFELQASTFSGELRTEPPSLLRSTNVSTGRRGASRSIRGTAGDGSAVIVMTTFSGDATIRR
jgi:DUF4097 and DUF4098 domain-containing protein YvlB